MPLSPQRPFVPRRTPKTAQPSVVASEFRISPPFLPRTERNYLENTIAAPVDAALLAELAPPHAEIVTQLPPIEEFLDTRSQFSEARQDQQLDSGYESEALESEDELPPLEHFVDPLPEVGAYAPDSEELLLAAAEGAVAEHASVRGSISESAATDWVETDWQQFDWRSVAALGESETANVEASSAWAATDWDARLTRAQQPRESAADAIARALDEIAQRIRSGDLALPSAGVAPDPATIAATLAALLGVRR